ncbi:hypothetical protein Tco_0241850 [Tanacetum coccineum]
MEECHRLLTDKIDLMNPEGHRVVPDVSKPLPLGGPPGQLKATHYLDIGLEELVSSLWIESERDYDISAAYVRSHMRILSVTSLKTYERYGYTYLREIVLRRADYNKYKISKADFKNLHLDDFEDLYLLHLQGKLNHLPGSDKVHLFNADNMWTRNIVIRQCVEDLQLSIESYQTKLNLTQLSWDALDFLFKEDYTIVSKSRAVIYRDRSDQKKMIRLNEVHKFSDGTLIRVLEKLDQMVKDFRLSDTYSGNPVKEILLKLNLPDHRSVLTDLKHSTNPLTIRLCDDIQYPTISTSGSRRLLVLVIVGIVVGIVVGKNMVGLDFVEKFGYVGIIVEVATVEITFFIRMKFEGDMG